MSRYTADEIQVLTGLEALRHRPRLYARTGAPLEDSIVEAAACLGLKALIGGCADRLRVQVEGRWSVAFEHDGRFDELLAPVGGDGAPLGEVLMHVLWACKHLVGPEDPCDITLPLATALSRSCSIEIRCAAVSHRARFEAGVLAEPLTAVDAPERGTDGVRLHFQLDPEFFDAGLDGHIVERVCDAIVGRFAGIEAVRLGPESWALVRRGAG